MKLTKKTVKHEVETTESVCEITQAEFEKMCAETAAQTIVQFIGDDPDVDDLMIGVLVTRLFADYAHNLTNVLFPDTAEDPDKKSNKEEK